MSSSRQHWNGIFTTKTDSELGWQEGDAAQTLKFLEPMELGDDATVFLPGAGTSVLADALWCRGGRLILNDISEQALGSLRKRIGGERDGVFWLHHDISIPLPAGLPQVDAWIDRAVLHFLLDEAAIQGYFANLRTSLRAGGYALLAEFAADGAARCAGLEVRRYTLAEMVERLGAGFELVGNEDYTYINPSGEARPYIYALFRRR